MNLIPSPRCSAPVRVCVCVCVCVCVTVCTHASLDVLTKFANFQHPVHIFTAYFSQEQIKIPSTALCPEFSAPLPVLYMPISFPHLVMPGAHAHTHTLHFTDNPNSTSKECELQVSSLFNCL